MTNNSPELGSYSLADRYDWVLFDQGGTLFDPLPNYYSERNQRLAVRELGYPEHAQHPQLALWFRRARVDADAAFLKRPAYTHQQLVTEHLVRGLLTLGVCDVTLLNSYQRASELPADLRTVADRYFDRQREAVVDHLRLKAGCHRMLAVLSRSARLAIVSNNADSYLHPLVARYRIDAYMQDTLSSDALGACKPNAEIFEHAFERLGIEPDHRSRVLYVGDSVRFDVVGAQSAGVDVVLVTDSCSDHGGAAGDPREPRANFQVTNLAELADLFQRAQASG